MMWWTLESCVVCGARSSGLCGRCRASLEPPPAVCLRPFLDRSWLVFAYVGVGIELVSALKFQNRRGALTSLVDALVAGIQSEVGPGSNGLDAVVPVPASLLRRRERGYDVPDLIARRVGRGLGLPVRHALRRIDEGAQRGQSRSSRLLGPNIAAEEAVFGRVLLIDDVVTTGTTARSCAGALRQAGATNVDFAALAATP